MESSGRGFAKTGVVSAGATSFPPAVVGLVVAITICLRLGPQPFRKVWAEDGGVFLADFSTHGWRSVGYLYSGYLSVPSRLLAALGAATLSLSLYPVWCAVASVVVAGALAAFVFASARRRVAWWALAPSLAIALAPALRGESLGNLANLQALLIPAACWASPEQRVTGPAVALAASLASPLAIFALPILAMRRALRSTVALVLGLAVQATAMLIAPHSAHHGVVRVVPSARRLLDELSVGLRLAVVGQDLRRTGELLVVLVGIVVLLLVTRAQTRPFESYLFGLCALGLAVAAIAPSPKLSDRYLVAPTILLVSALTLLEVPRRIARGALACGVILALMSFPVGAYRRSGRVWNGNACAGRPVALIAAAPRNWGVAVLTCARLRS